MADDICWYLIKEKAHATIAQVQQKSILICLLEDLLTANSPTFKNYCNDILAFIEDCEKQEPKDLRASFIGDSEHLPHSEEEPTQLQDSQSFLEEDLTASPELPQ